MKQNNPKVEKLIESYGIMAETLKIAYDSFINAGFTEEQAMLLTIKELEWMQEE